LALYQPMHGWDATIHVRLDGGTVFEDASEIYGIKFDESWNLERRKQLGVKIKESMPGNYEAKGSATAYFITSEMVSVLYGIDNTDEDRSHAGRVAAKFDLLIDFSDFPIQVKAAGEGSPAGLVNLIGYRLLGCLLETDSFELKDGEYVEKPLEFSIEDVEDVYDTD
jgi:hypothetical protein